MLSVPPTLVAVAAVVGVLAAWAGVIVAVLMLLWNKLDKRFDDLEARQNQRFNDFEARQNQRFDQFEARQNQRFDQQDKRLDELKAEMQEGRAEMRALREALLSIKA